MWGCGLYTTLSIWSNYLIGHSIRNLWSYLIYHVFTLEPLLEFLSSINQNIIKINQRHPGLKI
jgi:hypothetical protein